MAKREAPRVTRETREKYVGKVARLSTEGLEIEVLIKDVSFAFGHHDFLVTPVAGSGEKKVRETRVSLV